MSAPPDEALSVVLKHYFGYDAFRPLQREIIHEVLSGRDALALLPTGGGKSLCYQLPAVARPGLVLVVSPLIALMKDQVDALTAAGVPATFLNSSLEAQESRRRLEGLRRGGYRLLYAAPERLLLSGFLAELQAWKPWLIAVDEAHCISEWGHDFRPEYRRLAELRAALPRAAMLALTATAAPRVREDIVRQAPLREPKVFVASFNRPNLTYAVEPKKDGARRVLELARGRPGDAGIVYAQSRRSVEALAERLKAGGVEAAAYHAGLEAEERSRVQEAFLRDEVRVVCATIAFGMGVNKPNVRFVVHYDLPKNVESYYQETGRAGRDGLPSDCLLLFSAGDAVKQRVFIDELEDAEQAAVARRQLQEMVHFAESSSCRRAALLSYFGEAPASGTCGSCDNCLAPRETFDATLPAQKLLSCVYRIREKSGFPVGLAHVVEVLTGAQTEKVRRWGHDALSTYGIGKDRPRAEWAELGRELARLGYLSENHAKMGALELTQKGRQALVKREAVVLTKPRAAAGAGEPSRRRSGSSLGAGASDDALFERLRVLRRRLADQRGVPAYIILSDATLKELSARKPRDEAALLGVSGIGDKKRRDFGAALLAEIEAYLSA